MERLRGAGCSVGEYAGDGQGESAPTELHSIGEGTVDAGPEVEHLELEEDDDDGDGVDGIGRDDHHPLLIFYDCEATGLSIRPVARGSHWGVRILKRKKPHLLLFPR